MTREALLVAQHVVFRQALALVLEQRESLKATQVGSRAEAHQVLHNLDAAPDLTIIDLELPNGEGFELIEEIRETWPRIPVLALTTSQDPERHARAKEAGAGEVFATTASGEKILEEVKRLEIS